MTTINSILQLWTDLSSQLKHEALLKVANHLDSNNMSNDDILKEMLEVAAEYEDEDYFGTEGLSI